MSAFRVKVTRTVCVTYCGNISDSTAGSWLVKINSLFWFSELPTLTYYNYEEHIVGTFPIRQRVQDSLKLILFSGSQNHQRIGLCCFQLRNCSYRCSNLKSPITFNFDGSGLLSWYWYYLDCVASPEVELVVLLFGAAPVSVDKLYRMKAKATIRINRSLLKFTYWLQCNAIAVNLYLVLYEMSGQGEWCSSIHWTWQRS